jgi:dipeptidyl aminopeptidase/acylaminoacyl peptidase
MSFRAASLLLIAFVVAPGTFAAGADNVIPRFSMDDALSVPFVDALVPSPDRKALVWTVHVRGARNVAVWQNGRARIVTAFTEDDGAEIEDAQLTPDGRAVVYERGGASDNAGGENPNPLSRATSVPRKIMLTVIDGPTVEVGDGRQPAVSPKGNRVAWIAGGKVVSATIGAITGNAAPAIGKTEPLFEVRGAAASPVWSPDGTRIAVSNDRKTHAFIAIYTLGAKVVTLAAPAFANDAAPVWSPDGRHIAFVRTPALTTSWTPYDDPHEDFYSAIPAREPWSIVVADAATGVGRVVWRADRSMGHAFSIADNGTPLSWMRDDTLAFVWERDGWRHLYAVSAAGGRARLLTPGRFEVEQNVATADRSAILFTSNQDDVARRHVWRVGLEGSRPVRVSSGRHSQWSPVGMTDGTIAYVDAGWADPPMVTLVANGKLQTVDADPAAQPHLQQRFVAPQPVTFRATDGLTIHGELFVPRDGASRHPALIFVHGGPPRQMLPGFHYFEAYTHLYELNQALTNHGFVILSVDYRSGIMFGHDFRDAPQRGFFGASEYRDVLGGAHFLQARRDVDPQRLGIYGQSYGGYLTALALARDSSTFKAGVDIAGVYDWSKLIDSSFGHPMGSQSQRAVAFAASPVAALSSWRSPVLLSQGDDDRNVPFSEGVDLAQALLDRGVDVQTLAFPNETHENLLYADLMRQYEATADFLTAHLGAAK